MSTEQEMIDLYVQAEKDVLEGKTISFNGRTMTMENLQEIRSGRQEWERRLNSRARRGKSYRKGRITW